MARGEHWSQVKTVCLEWFITLTYECERQYKSEYDVITVGVGHNYKGGYKAAYTGSRGGEAWRGRGQEEP